MRVLSVQLVAGVATVVFVVLAGSAGGQNTQVEIHQFMTATSCGYFNPANPEIPIAVPSDFVTNPDVVVNPGGSACLAVFIRALPGDLGTTIVTSYNYEITGQGNVGSFQPGRRRDRPMPYAPPPGSPAPGDPAVDYADLPGTDSQLFGLTGGNFGTTIRSDSPGDFYYGTFYLQLIEIVAAAAASPGDTLNLYMTTPKTASYLYATQGSAGSQVTVAFGYDPQHGRLDSKRASDPTRDIIGTLNDRVSSVPDAVIHVIPEPAVAALLACGLALRTRRAS